MNLRILAGSEPRAGGHARPSARWATKVLFPQISGGNVTKSVPHKTLTLIARGKLTFDERSWSVRVDVPPSPSAGQGNSAFPCTDPARFRYLLCTTLRGWPPGVALVKEAWSFYITISSVRLCWELEEHQGPKGSSRLSALSDEERARASK